MDILNSQILNIEGRLYINYLDEEPSQPDISIESIREPQKEKLTKIDENVTVKLSVPTALFKYVIGTRGETKKRIENETGTRIYIPKRGQHGDIVLKSDSQSNVNAAKTRIELMLSEKRWREPFTHFVSIPLVNESVVQGFSDFKSKVLQDFSGDHGIEERLFQKANKLHLTIVTLVLLNENECCEAVETLNRVIKDEVRPTISKEMMIDVSGIEYMNDDPRMVDVLYAKVKCKDDSSTLQSLADTIASSFVNAGLSKAEYEHVKLHATVMNSLFAKAKEPGRQSKQQTQRETFDAKNILERFKDFQFGGIPLNEIHISRRSSTNQNGYYDNIHVAKLAL